MSKIKMTPAGKKIYLATKKEEVLKKVGLILASEITSDKIIRFQLDNIELKNEFLTNLSKENADQILNLYKELDLIRAGVGLDVVDESKFIEDQARTGDAVEVITKRGLLLYNLVSQTGAIPGNSGGDISKPVPSILHGSTVDRAFEVDGVSYTLLGIKREEKLFLSKNYEEKGMLLKRT